MGLEFLVLISLRESAMFHLWRVANITAGFELQRLMISRCDRKPQMTEVLPQCKLFLSRPSAPAML